MTTSIVATYVSVIPYLYCYLVIFDLVFYEFTPKYTVHVLLITFKIKLFKLNVSLTKQFLNKSKQFSP